MKAQLSKELEGAALLLEYAISNGKSIDDEQIASVTEAHRIMLDEAQVDPHAEARFAAAYRDLAQLLSPVTAETLKATADEHGRKHWLLAPLHPRSEGKLWSRKLWFWTAVSILFILASQNYESWLVLYAQLDEYSDRSAVAMHTVSMAFQSMLPFSYGALGALAYLLRSAHIHLHQRTFSPLHLPEYYNRMLLGILAGGTVKLFITTIADETGAFVNLSAAALAFIAGYNCDFLFSAVERIGAAILPKVEISTVQRSQPLAGLSMEDLLRLHETASPAGKRVIERLIEKLGDRI